MLRRTLGAELWVVRNLESKEHRLYDALVAIRAKAKK